MSPFRRLSFASTAATFLLVAIGGLVRATKSGLGCGDDWPRCAGRLLPALENRAVMIEFSHRLMASVVVVLIGLLAFIAWRRHRDAPALVWGATIAFGLVLFQAVLGAVVVWLELAAISVVLHLATAMALVAVLIYVSISAWASEHPEPVSSDARLARRARLAAAGVLGVILIGSYVTGRGAGYVFPDWPLMDGRLVPDLSYEPAALHFLHRVLAAIVGVFVAFVAMSVIRAPETSRLASRFAHTALGLFVIQILIGAANVWTYPGRVNESFVTLHLLTAALIWGSVVALAVVASPSVVARRAGVEVPQRPAYDAG
ncbi:MAG TPA: COX15/CtaA family protein [Actinomycetota bacterium]|nr:COX15/CtaA family protein [Actinomycetota bacterium]